MDQGIEHDTNSNNSTEPSVKIRVRWPPFGENILLKW